ncbi:ABC transporter ATP-binding protein [Shinella sp.]|uniref:ABC transporter ATP-binding protein n=1 Tax=Shinella sp. TaxID=1870904 RepID=UPI003F6EB347
MTPERRSDLAALRRLWRLTARHRGLVLTGMFCRFLQAGTLGLTIVLAVTTVANLANGKAVTEALAMQVTALMAVALAGQLVFGILATRACWIASHRIAGHLRLVMLDRLRRLPMDFHIARHRGEAVTALTGDMQALEVFIADGLPRIAQAIGLPLVLFCLLAATDWRAGLVGAVSIVLALPVLLWSSRRLATLAAGRQTIQAEAATRIVEYVNGMKVIRAFNRLADGHLAFRQALDRLHTASAHMIAALAAPIIAFAAIVMLGLPLLIGFLGYRHDTGTMPTDVLITVLGLAMAFYPSVLSLIAIMETTRLADASIARMDRILATTPLPEPAVPAFPNGFDIVFDKVGFSYVSDKPALREVSFKVPTRSMLAIVGPSGAGKSTILNLLLRFWDIGEGRILLGGVDLRAMSYETLAAQIAVVFQDVYLFSGTIHDAIAEGRPGASRAEVEAAAREAQAHDFITALPEGYDTTVGEGGGRLSGGERQRIAIARAILKDAPIVLLDEATAAIDPSNERAIQTALARLVADRTLIVIAHRLSTIRDADHILVLEDGRVCEDGSFDGLIARGGLFARLWSERAQASHWQVGGHHTVPACK